MVFAELVFDSERDAAPALQWNLYRRLGVSALRPRLSASVIGPLVGFVTMVQPGTQAVRGHRWR